MTKATPAPASPSAPSLVASLCGDATPVATWSLLHVTEKGMPVMTPLRPRPCYPMKRLRLSALRSAATLYNSFAKIQKYGRMKRRDWYEKYTTGALPDLFMHFLHETLAKSGIETDEESVQKDIDAAKEKANGVPYLLQALHKEKSKDPLPAPANE